LAGMILIEVVLTVLIADFISGFFHWLEDAYGREDWPVIGRLVTQPNVLHHHNPRFFTRYGWWHSSWDLLCISLCIVGVAWLCGVLTWHVWLFAVLGTNANQFHKWAHRSPAENGVLISLLQRLRLIQTPQHHAKHHTDPKNSAYCVLTNFLNPALDSIRFWDFLEKMIWVLFRLRRRVDTSLASTPKALEHNQRPGNRGHLPILVRPWPF
jgi:hypothetical protein